MPALFALAVAGTLGGGALLVLAYRRGQAGDAAGERVRFWAAVVALALGSLALLGGTILAG